MSEDKEFEKWKLKGCLIPITECKYFEGIGNCKETKCLCVDNKDCYFKKLKRLEQQIEAYKQSENEAKEIIAELEHKNNCLHKKNDKLKKEINRLETEMRNFYFSTVLDFSSMNIQEIRQLQQEAIDTGKSISEVYASSKCMYDRKHMFDCLEAILRIMEEKPENMTSLIKTRIENCYNLIKMGDYQG